MKTDLDIKKTLVLGASLKVERYSNQAINMLRDYDHSVLAHGLREGEVRDVNIVNDLKALEGENIDTITLYLNPQRQEQYQEWIIGMKPRRVIFNPGTENPGFMAKLTANGIHPVVACTLVMLRTRQYD